MRVINLLSGGVIILTISANKTDVHFLNNLRKQYMKDFGNNITENR